MSDILSTVMRRFLRCQHHHDIAQRERGIGMGSNTAIPAIVAIGNLRMLFGHNDPDHVLRIDGVFGMRRSTPMESSDSAIK